MSNLTIISVRAVAFVALAVALLSVVSAVTLGAHDPGNGVPAQVYSSVVAGLWITAALAGMVGGLPLVNHRMGDSPRMAVVSAVVLASCLIANAVALSGELSRFPQSYTSLLAAVLALIGAVFSVLSMTAAESGRDDYSSL
ncbi:hypothetical protein [Nocardioides sp.]|uniref:hypothetical protein n=1 Tax=Nocardioides sp. TaxID=35761 RepID=UPI003D0F0AD2